MSRDLSRRRLSLSLLRLLRLSLSRLRLLSRRLSLLLLRLRRRLSGLRLLLRLLLLLRRRLLLLFLLLRCLDWEREREADRSLRFFSLLRLLWWRFLSRDLDLDLERLADFDLDRAAGDFERDLERAAGVFERDLERGAGEVDLLTAFFVSSLFGLRVFPRESRSGLRPREPLRSFKAGLPPGDRDFLSSGDEERERVARRPLFCCCSPVAAGGLCSRGEGEPPSA